ncbi:hypothetical protein BX666DRAFT_793476 [Dichotomocladium elegans]|nr:hypothetical protein BX666DRAFT_793476 [Dichotomocladium elegans]
MELQILKLSKQPNHQPLIEYLDNQSLEEIESVLNSKLKCGSSKDDVDPLLIVRALLIGSPAAAEGHLHMDRRVLVLKTSFNW